ncbi:hypothetical protein, partial [Mucilaginibacter sp.]|uniref:hypothetical protein n=1 Tax=Mucilaginibacter sp. TaxID=1882438 RepID=UPI0025E581DF
NRIAIPLSTGIGWGDFALPVLTRPGSYQIRAYTNWMRNFAADYFFDQSIIVSDTQLSIIKRKQKAGGDPDVQFFPEGGAIINGLRSKVAVKAISTKGIAEDIDGSIIDNDGNEVAVFSTQHLGMGVFAIIPQTGKNYKAKITRKDGKQFTVSLPKAQDDGFSIAVNNSQPDSISIRVASSAKLFETEKGARYYLLAQAGAKVYYTADFKLLSQSFTTRIDKQRFPTGIVQFTLFAENGEPLNERIAFIQHNDQLKLGISTAKEVYATRQKVNIAIKVADKDSKPVVGSFSAAVINEDLAGTKGISKNSILSNLLLTSDIKGYIEDPDYYFTNISDKTRADLDLLMLTQGFHRFEWKQVMNGKNPELLFDPETALTVAGYLKTNGGKPVSKGKVLMYKTKGGWFKKDTLTNEKGRFVFKDLVTDPDSTLKYVIQGRTGFDKKNLVTSIDTMAPFKTQPGNHTNVYDRDTLSVYQKTLNQQLKLSLDKRLISLKEVTIKAEKEPSRWGAIDPDQILRGFPKDASGETLSFYLTTRLRGITFQNGLPYTSRDPKTVMNILLDGSIIPPELFGTILASDVESIEVLRTTGKVDLLTGVGNVIVITSKRGQGLYTRQETPNVITYPSNGLYKAREFYSPKYEGPKTVMQTNDLRTTIYWKPDIITDKDGNTSLSFFNADTKGTYRITVEGIDTDGNIGHQVLTYKVE